jgi:hypothetical protein
VFVATIAGTLPSETVPRCPICAGARDAAAKGNRVPRRARAVTDGIDAGRETMEQGDEGAGPLGDAGVAREM